MKKSNITATSHEVENGSIVTRTVFYIDGKEQMLTTRAKIEPPSKEAQSALTASLKSPNGAIFLEAWNNHRRSHQDFVVIYRSTHGHTPD